MSDEWIEKLRAIADRGMSDEWIEKLRAIADPVDQELLNQIFSYEETIDGEWGYSQSAKQIEETSARSIRAVQLIASRYPEMSEDGTIEMKYLVVTFVEPQSAETVERLQALVSDEMPGVKLMIIEGASSAVLIDAPSPRRAMGPAV